MTSGGRSSFLCPCRPTVHARVALIVFGLLVAALAVASAQENQPAPTKFVVLQQMPADADPSFEVATIRHSDPNLTTGWSFEDKGRHIDCTNATVFEIISVAYGIHAKQITGGPNWVREDRFDIDGVPNVLGMPNLEQERGMYRKLLSDRLHLKFHRETREIPIYEITVAKGGPRNMAAAKSTETLNTGSRGGGGQRTLRFSNMPTSMLAFNLGFYLDRPVIDRTGLEGRYDFTLKWTFDESRSADSDAPPLLPTALVEQLGLEMKAVRGPAEVLVIDHVEQPSPN